MAALTEAEIHALASVDPEGSIVTSLYLDVDGARYVRPADYERTLDGLLDEARSRPEYDEQVGRDLDQIAERVGVGFDRSRVRGVAVFACGAQGLFTVHELPVPVRNEITLNPRAAVGQLELIVQQSEKIAVLAADKAHARVFVFRLGELVDRTEVTDDLGRDYDSTGEHDRGTPDAHRDELAQQHLRHAVDLLWREFQGEGFEHLVIAATDPVAAELEGMLHPYLRERLHGRLPCSAKAPPSELRDATVAAEREIERNRESALVERLRERVAKKNGAVSGLDAVLDAVADRRVERLLVSDGFRHEGWRCGTCGRLAKVGRECRCGAEMDHIADVVGAAVDDALASSCPVDMCDGNADLDVLGRIGALLRY